MRYGVDPSELQTLAARWAEGGEAGRDAEATLRLAPDVDAWCVSDDAAFVVAAALAAVEAAQADLVATAERTARALDLAAQAYGRADRPVPR